MFFAILVLLLFAPAPLPKEFVAKDYVGDWLLVYPEIGGEIHLSLYKNGSVREQELSRWWSSHNCSVIKSPIPSPAWGTWKVLGPTTLSITRGETWEYRLKWNNSSRSWRLEGFSHTYEKNERLPYHVFPVIMQRRK
jgi:hypothetical protein